MGKNSYLSINSNNNERFILSFIVEVDTNKQSLMSITVESKKTKLLIEGLHLLKSGQFCSFCGRYISGLRNHIKEHFINNEENLKLKNIFALFDRIENSLSIGNPNEVDYLEFTNLIDNIYLPYTIEFNIKRIYLKHLDKIGENSEEYKIIQFDTKDFLKKLKKFDPEYFVKNLGTKTIQNYIHNQLTEKEISDNFILNYYNVPYRKPIWMTKEIENTLISELKEYSNWKDMIENILRFDHAKLSEILFSYLNTENDRIQDLYKDKDKIAEKLQRLNMELYEKYNLWIPQEEVIISRNKSEAIENPELFYIFLRMGIFEVNSFEIGIYEVKDKNDFAQFLYHRNYDPEIFAPKQRFFTVYDQSINHTMFKKITTSFKEMFSPFISDRRIVVYAYDVTGKVKSLIKAVFISNGQDKSIIEDYLKIYNPNFEFYLFD